MGTVIIFPPTNKNQKRKRKQVDDYKLDDFVVTDSDNEKELTDGETSNESENNIMNKLTDKEDSDDDVE